jgi:origin recognition complex subunit 3
LFIRIQVAFIFNPEEDEPPRRERPPKRRKTARRSAVAEDDEEDEDGGLRSSSWFAPLLGESMACARRRERLLEESWAMVDARIQVSLMKTFWAAMSL